jgi:hypothetical protein
MPDDAMTLSQIDLFAAISAEIDRQYPGARANPRQYNAIIAAANAIVAEFARDHEPARPGSGLRAWLHSDDTGLSSLAMARRLAPLAGLGESVPGPRFPDDRDARPHDPADLGRCVRLLEAVPELRPHLPAMAGVSREWAALVGAWDELEALYREELPTGRGPRCYARMRELTDEPKEAPDAR